MGVMSLPVGLQPVHTKMRRSFIHARPNDSLLQAVQIMQLARIRHLPVLDGERLVGIVSHRDLLEASASPLDESSQVERFDRLRSVPLSRVMNTAVCTIDRDLPLREVAERMLRHKIGCLLVVDEASECSVLGLITEADLLAAAYLPELDARTLREAPEA
jgi:CBS domain-containing membrane protein